MLVKSIRNIVFILVFLVTACNKKKGNTFACLIIKFKSLKAMVFDRMNPVLHQYYQNNFIFVSIISLLNEY